VRFVAADGRELLGEPVNEAIDGEYTQYRR
jgi:hypothetical protein